MEFPIGEPVRLRLVFNVHDSDPGWVADRPAIEAAADRRPGRAGEH